MVEPVLAILTSDKLGKRVGRSVNSTFVCAESDGGRIALTGRSTLGGSIRARHQRLDARWAGRCIGVDDPIGLAIIVEMDSREAADAFARQYKRAYHRFHRRLPPQAYRPSRETLALLEHLTRTGPLTITEAAQHFSRSQSTMSELVDRVESRGLVTRVADQRDRRRSLLWLTEKGERVLADGQDVLSHRLLEHAMEQLSSRQRRALAECLAELLETEPTEEGWDHD